MIRHNKRKIFIQKTDIINYIRAKKRGYSIVWQGNQAVCMERFGKVRA